MGHGDDEIYHLIGEVQREKMGQSRMFVKSTNMTTNEMLTSNGAVINQMRMWAEGYCDAISHADYVMQDCKNTQNREPSTEIIAVVFDSKSGSILALWSLTVRYSFA